MVDQLPAKLEHLQAVLRDAAETTSYGLAHERRSDRTSGEYVAFLESVEVRLADLHAAVSALRGEEERLRMEEGYRQDDLAKERGEKPWLAY